MSGILFLDLHGFSQKKAELAVLRLFSSALTNEITTVRVVTGRGNHINPNGTRAVLFNNFPHWLKNSAFQHRIKQVRQFDGFYDIAIQHDNDSAEHRRASLQYHDEILEKNAQLGDPEAMTLLALSLVQSASENAQLKRAFELLKQAADQDFVPAMLELGVAYLMGRGVRKSSQSAMAIFQKAASLGSADAYLQLGDCYWLGDGVAINFKLAVANYVQAATRGSAMAMRKVAFAYKSGHGAIQDLQKSTEWYHKAALAGDATAQYNVASCYMNGIGVKESPELAAKFFIMAAEHGDIDAQYFIGRQLIAKDATREGIELIEEASSGGCIAASSYLAEKVKFDDQARNELYLARAAQGGDIYALFKLKLSQRDSSEKDLADTKKAKLMHECYLEIRDTAVEKLLHFDIDSVHLSAEFMLSDQSKRYRDKGLKLLKDMASQNDEVAQKILQNEKQGRFKQPNRYQVTTAAFFKARRIQSRNSLSLSVLNSQSRPTSSQPELTKDSSITSDWVSSYCTIL